jgi:hypothetical protein
MFDVWSADSFVKVRILSIIIMQLPSIHSFIAVVLPYTKSTSTVPTYLLTYLLTFGYCMDNAMDMDMNGINIRSISILIDLESSIDRSIEPKGRHEPHTAAKEPKQYTNHTHVGQIDHHGQDPHQLEATRQEPERVQE